MYVMKVESELIIPDWARWMAKDADGEWWYYQNKPTQLDTFWLDYSKNAIKVAYNDILGGDDWKDSLTEIVRC